MHQLQPFAHADQAQTVANESVLFFKATSKVGHCEVNRLSCALEIHRKAPNTAVLHGVLQPLLQNSEQTQRDFLWEIVWYARMFEDNLNPGLFGELSAEALGRGSQAKVFEF